MKRSMLFKVLPFVLILQLSSCNNGDLFYKGNMHTHTLWSDGDDFPENVTGWYKENGYDFLVLTDHNIIQEGENWKSLPENHPAILKTGNIEKKKDEKTSGNVNVRLKQLDEFRSEFEEKGKFILIPGNEITCPASVHLTSFYQEKALPAPKGGEADRSRMIGDAVRLVDDYRRQSGRNTYPALAHPNFRWAITAEMILENPDLRFFEVYNGHVQVNNNGDKYRADTDRIWDIVLANRLQNGGKMIYGLAVDDSHNYHLENGYKGNGPGKGWVMINSGKLSPESLLNALDKGDFYSSTGVALKDIRFNGKTLNVRIRSTEGVNYLTEFIGTRRNFNTSSSPTLDSAGMEIPNTTRVYSNQIGEILASSSSTEPSYTFKGDELYVRVRITSSADQTDPLSGNTIGKQRAWVQPQVPE